MARDRELDLPPLVAAFGRRLHEAGVPVTPERSARFAEALTLTRAGRAHAAVLDGARGAGVRPRRRCAAFDRVFFDGLRVARRPTRRRRRRTSAREPRAADDAPGRAPARARRAAAPGGAGRAGARRRASVGSAHDARAGVPGRWRATRSALRAQALRRARAGRARAALPADDAQLELATPTRRTRRAERARRGEHIDLRRTLRGAPAHRRRPDPARAQAPPRRAAPARAAVRHQRLDGALRARLPAVPHVRRAATPRRSCSPPG